MTRFGSILLVFAMLQCRADGSEFIESFDGDGAFTASNSEVDGFDNPGWFVASGGYFERGGLAFADETTLDTPFSSSSVSRDVLLGSGSFFHRLELDVQLDPIPFGQVFGSSGLALFHYFNSDSDTRQALVVSLTATEGSSEKGVWLLGIGIEGNIRNIETSPGNNILLEVEFDNTNKAISVMYDHNASDAIGPEIHGPYPYSGKMEPDQYVQLSLNAFHPGGTHVNIGSWTLMGEYTGDFNMDGNTDIADIDLLLSAILLGVETPKFDLNLDGSVDFSDRDLWVHKIKRTFFGDSDLDGEFNSNDLVEVFQAGEYDDGVEGNSSWSSGDWNGDHEFNSRDLVLAFQDAGYESGPRASRSVPEPNFLFVALLVGFLGINKCRQQ